jgi:cytoskeletal protein RodZ
MKTIITLTAAAALIAGMGIASAQNAPSTPPQNSSPNSINKSNLPSPNSGSESQATAKKKGKTLDDKTMREQEKSQTSGATPTSK